MSIGQELILLMLLGMILIVVAGIIIESIETKRLKKKEAKLKRHNKYLISQLEFELIKRRRSKCRHKLKV